MNYRHESHSLKKILISLALGIILASGCGKDERGTQWVSAEEMEIPPPNYEYEAAAAHILIMHAESVGGDPSITRERWQAEDLARRIALEARERGADFAELARKYSEDPRTRDRGGFLGIFRRGKMVLPFDAAVFRMEVGQTGRVVETDFGFHVINRLPIHRVRANHILIAWQGATQATEAVTRTRGQARALAREVWQQAAARGADLCELTRKFSDDANNRTLCGDLGIVQDGFLSPEFETALFRLRPGMVSDVIETEFGFHIAWQRK